jgi:SAM-dependent methyltransferase
VAEGADIEGFWDARAREDAFYFVDNRLEYGHPDVERFFADGRADLDELLGRLGAVVAPGQTVVDIGCGLGRLSRALAARAGRVLAIDVSQEMLDRAQELNQDLDNVEWVHGDGLTLTGIDDAAADACVSHVVFQHIPDAQITLGYVAEMGRVLKPGGWTAFQISNDPSVHQPRGKPPRRGLLRRGPKGQGHPAWLGSSVDLDDLRATAADAGLDIEQIQGEGTQYCLVLARRHTP